MRKYANESDKKIGQRWMDRAIIAENKIREIEMNHKGIHSCDGTCLENKVKELKAKLERAREYFMKYADHSYACNVLEDDGKTPIGVCTCGLREAIEALSQEDLKK